jgi:hypothetical protein
MGAKIRSSKSLIFLSHDYYKKSQLLCLRSYREIIKSLREHYYLDYEFDMQKAHVRAIINKTPKAYVAIEHRNKQAEQLKKLFAIGKFPNLIKYLK